MRVLLLTITLLLSHWSPAAAADGYPSQRISVIAPFAPGSGTDGVARIVFQRLSELLKTTIIIDNRVGANGALGATAAARSAPDGYTLLVGGTSTHAANPSLLKSIQYDPIADFAPISQFGLFPYFLIVDPGLPVKSVADLVALAKSKPGTLTFGYANALGQLSGEAFKRRAGIDIAAVPYRNSPQVVTDIIAQRVSMTFMDMAPAVSQVEAGQARALATTNPDRASLFPDIPTMKEGGLAFINISAWSGLFAPKDTPPEIVARLAEGVREVLAEPEIRKRLADIGFEAQWIGPAEFAKHVKDDMDLWATTTREAGIERQ
ncbi:MULTISPECIES: Bug family tripartite tricarboxylate transporter substrate binding protein [Bradyrhizobium]|uniref:Bug family tripartite tricarboxylate transporter substrate binding protein n=1 Tax=Bradyrhizobium TaxID=374 RepID=UPI0007C5B72B|nr:MULTISPECIES: tripartite tricarboxylate transporter substrate binding protein [Bradyrhizobium]UFW48112.1 tripartite tricarboxylate transporter substrate binding protein [Bradyrhizobium arachidis]